MSIKDEFKTLPKIVVNLFFIIGVISAISFRVIIAFQYFMPSVVRVIWYIGVVGYFSFFLYRYIISRRRKTIVTKYKLIDKLQSGDTLSENEKHALLYVVSSIDKSRENYNYYFIFILSIIAITFDIIMQLMGR